jgi:hypothetical protein
MQRYTTALGLGKHLVINVHGVCVTSSVRTVRRARLPGITSMRGEIIPGWQIAWAKDGGDQPFNTALDGRAIVQPVARPMRTHCYTL